MSTASQDLAEVRAEREETVRLVRAGQDMSQGDAFAFLTHELALGQHAADLAIELAGATGEHRIPAVAGVRRALVLVCQQFGTAGQPVTGHYHVEGVRP